MDGINPYNKYRILSHYQEIKTLKSGIISMPRMAIVYPSYYCQQDCKYCFYANEREDHRKSMYTKDQFFYVLRTLHNLGIRGVEFCGGGEPFTNPHMLEAVQYGAELGLKFGGLTNGGLLKTEMLDEIIKSFSYIRFSIDSFDRQRYCEIRGTSSAQYDIVRSNLHYLASNKSDSLKVGVKLLLSRDSFPHITADIQAALDICEEIGVDSLQIKVAEQLGDQINDVYSLDEQLESWMSKRIPDYRLKILFGSRKTEIREQCWLNPLQLTVDALGDVYLCCYFQHRKESHRLCNIFDNDLLYTWGSPRHRGLIKNIKIPECNVYNCRFHGYHEMVNKLEDFQLEFC